MDSRRITRAIVEWGAHGALLLVRGIPHRVRILFFATILYTFLYCSRKYWSICHRNLTLVFPALSQRERQAILWKNTVTLGRLLSDCIRLPSLDGRWIESHIDTSEMRRFHEKFSQESTGLLLLTGHFCSFDLLAHCFPFVAKPVHFVVRDFKNGPLEGWWRGIRERHGNKVISRKGAIRGLLKGLAQGSYVALLADQNVTRNHAVFAPFFGRVSACTGGPALIALRTKCPVIVIWLEYQGNDNYKVFAEELLYKDIEENTSLSSEEKRVLFTTRMNEAFERIIRKTPESWFWMHRRWKTTPEGVPEDFYSL